jgi:hypothetical protein
MKATTMNLKWRRDSQYVQTALDGMATFAAVIFLAMICVKGDMSNHTARQSAELQHRQGR